MRALVIDDQAKAAVRRVLDYANEHPYYVPSDGIAPGGNPAYVANLGSFRCVFTFTHSKGKIYRHLSISIPSEKYPNPIAVYTVAEMFGFTGWDGANVVPPDDWALDVNKQEHCIVIAQLT